MQIEKRAWYSETQAKTLGTHIYRGINGDEIELTEVTDPDDLINATLKFNDKFEKGIVVKYLRRGKPAKILHEYFNARPITRKLPFDTMFPENRNSD